VTSTTVSYDYLVYAVGAETQTFNIPGVKEHACFMKELQDAERVCFSYTKLVRHPKCGLPFRCNGNSWIVSPHDSSCSPCLLHSGLETAAFPGQEPAEIDRLLHMVVVGGGPTGIELRWAVCHP